MEIKIITETEGFDSLKKEWNTLAIRSNTHIYQTFEWNRTWWKYFGSKGKLHIILIYSDTRLMGIAPLFWDTIRVGRCTLYSGLRFLGSNVSQPQGEPILGLNAYSDYLDLIADPDYEYQVAFLLAEYLKTDSLQYDELVLEEVTENSLLFKHLVPMLKGSRYPVSVNHCSFTSKILLNNSWEAYLKRLSKNRRKKTRRYLKKAEDVHEKLFNIQEVHTLDELLGAYDALVSLHQKQWNRQGFPGTFYEERMYEFTKEIAKEFFKKGWIQIKRAITVSLKTNKKCIAGDMFFKYKKHLYSVHGALDQDSSLIGKGLGNIIFNITLKEAISDGYEVYDFLRGIQEYKFRRADAITANRSILIQKPGKQSKLKMMLAKMYIHIRRRIRVERIQFKLIYQVKERKLFSGTQAYLLFIFRRISAKKTSCANPAWNR